MVTHAEAFVLNNSPHPILDGVENKNNDENIIRPKQEYDNDANKSTRKRRLYSSESDFVAQDNQQPTPPAPLPDRVGSTDAKAEEDNTNTEEHDDQSTDDEQGDLGEGVHLQTLDTYVEAPPDYTKANSISFKMVCDRLEQLWIQRSGKGKRKVTKQEKLAYLMPKTLLKFLEGGSPYPYLRLIMPASDSTRPHTGLKEAKIIQTYKQAINLPRDGKLAKSMDQWRDSNMTGKQAAGDISLVIENVLKERMPCSGSKLTVGEINEWLDVVALVTKTRFNMPTEEVSEKSKWRRDLEKAIAGVVIHHSFCDHTLHQSRH